MTLLVSWFKISSHSFLMIPRRCHCAWRAFSSQAMCCARWMIKEQGKSARSEWLSVKNLQKGRWNNSFSYIIFWLVPHARYSLGWRWFQLILGAVAAELARSLNERERVVKFCPPPPPAAFSSDWATGAKSEREEWIVSAAQVFISGWLATRARSPALSPSALIPSLITPSQWRISIIPRLTPTPLHSITSLLGLLKRFCSHQIDKC